MNRYTLPQSTNITQLSSYNEGSYSIFHDKYVKKSWGKCKSLQIHIKINKIHYLIQIEKYDILVLTWNRKTKQLSWLNYYDLTRQQNDARIVLLFEGQYTYHKYTISLSHMTYHTIYLDKSETGLVIPLNSEYFIQSKDICDIMPDNLEEITTINYYMAS